MRQYRFDHAIKIVVDLVVSEPQHTPATRRKPCVAATIMCEFFVCRMRRAIDFDDKARGMAEKIGDIGSARRLSPELQSGQTMRAQGAP